MGRGFGMIALIYAELQEGHKMHVKRFLRQSSGPRDLLRNLTCEDRCREVPRRST